jgi:hypothetical protein
LTFARHSFNVIPRIKQQQSEHCGTKEVSSNDRDLPSPIFAIVTNFVFVGAGAGSSDVCALIAFGPIWRGFPGMKQTIVVVVRK